MSANAIYPRVFVDELARCGVTDACVAPGSRSAPLVLALAEDPRIAVHVAIDERSAGYQAVGIARGTGRPAIVASTSGTAAVNLHPAVVEAHESRVPLIVVTADRPPELRHTGANQTIDQLGLFGRSVRWFVETGVPDDIPGANAYWRSLACRAVAEARTGPVHLNVSFREPLVVDDAPVPEGRPDGAPWTRVADALGVGRPERVVIVAGDTDWDATSLLDLGWPVLAEPVSGLRTGPTAVSTYHHLLAHEPFARRHRPDLVVRVGRTGLSRPLLSWLAPDVPQVLVDPQHAWLDPTRSLSAIVAAPPDLPHGDGAWTDAWLEAEAVARRTIDALLDAEERPTEPRTARDTAAAVPDGGALVAASSMPVRDLDRFMAPRPLRVVANRGASGIDGTVSTALGVARARPTVALVGDLAFLHDRNGLLVDDRDDADLTIVVVNNDGGGIFHLLPYADRIAPTVFEDLFGTPHGVDLAAVAAAHGCPYGRVDRAVDLAQAVAPRGGVSVVEVRTDRRQNAALHRTIEHEVAAALGEG